ncbi:transposable element Tcb2 transposase [Trichonephila clavipes]|nr:transposable element Tcb2 transposase [Trichonephila clavipes]
MYPYGLNVIWNNKNLIQAVKQNDKESIYNSRNNSNKRKRVGKGGRKKSENRDIDTVKKEENFIIFENKLYKQIKGLPQGGPASNSLANLYLHHYEIVRSGRYPVRGLNNYKYSHVDIGTRFYTSNIKERHHYGGPRVLVWGGIMLNGRTELHIFDRGSVIGDRYCEEVLLAHVRPFRGAIGPDFIFMDGNARPHWTLAVEELLESEDITRMN